MGHDHDVPSRKEVQDAVVDALVGRTQLVNSIPKKIRGGTPKFVILASSCAMYARHLIWTLAGCFFSQSRIGTVSPSR